MICKNCRTEFSAKDKRSIFCGRSCSSSFNNKKRIVTPEQRRKTAETIKKRNKVKGEYCKIFFYTCSQCQNLFTSTYWKSYKSKYKACSKECQNILNSMDKKGKPNPKSKYANKSIDRTKYKHYRTLAEFNLKTEDIPKIIGVEKLQMLGMWSKENRSGVVRDHLYSVKDGFINQVSVDIVKHPANCEFITQKENSSKGCKSKITLEELLNRIKIW